MNLLKITGLSTILLLPVFILVFLRTFGENVYTIPIFFENGIPEDSVGCLKNSIPHQIPTFNLEDVQGGSITDKVLDGKYTIIDFYSYGDQELNRKKEFQLNRILSDAESTNNLQIIRICYDDDIAGKKGQCDIESKMDNDHLIHAFGSKEDVFNLAHCGFVMLHFPLNTSDIQIQNYTFVLVDRKRRIRGYYDGTDFDEADRLMIELDIIFKDDKLI